MKVKRIQTGYYVSTDDKYVIKRNDWKEWDIYRDVGRSDNRKEYLITYRLLKDAKKYVESKTKAMDVGNLLKETKMITVTDEDCIWSPCFPNNQVRVGISANHIGNDFYIKVNAWGMDDFGVEIEYHAYNERHLMQMYDHFKHYIYDKIVDGVSLEWFYEHGFVKF